MNRKVTILSVVVAIAVTTLAMVTVAFAAQKGGGLGQEKVTLCHNGHTITVGAPAKAAHLNHGDTEGACPADTEMTGPPEDTTTPDATAPETTTPDSTMLETTMEETTVPDATTPESTTPETTGLDDEGGLGQQKVTLCHNGHTITVGAPAKAAHLNHGDTEGPCSPEVTEGTHQQGEGVANGASHDVVNGPRRGADLYGNSSADVLRGSSYADFLQGGRGPDKMFGGPNSDYIDGVDGVAGNDVLDGGQGIDHCVGDKGDTFRYCDGNVVEVPVPSDAHAPTEVGH